MYRIISISAVIALLFSICSMKSQDGPPKHPDGKRWVMNPEFSDEFNREELDATKWLDHPTWNGREPGIFLPSQVSVKDGYTQIKGEKLKKDALDLNSMFFKVKE